MLLLQIVASYPFPLDEKDQVPPDRLRREGFEMLNRSEQARGRLLQRKSFSKNPALDGRFFDRFFLFSLESFALLKKKKWTHLPRYLCVAAKNGEQVAVRDDREEPGAWILARVIKYVPETHQYELKDDDDKEGIGIVTAPRSLVIRLEDNTKGVLRGERVLAVFPDTTSFYLGTVSRVSWAGSC